MSGGAPIAALEPRLRAALESGVGERTPSRVEWLEPGLGTRRFARVFFADGEPRTLVARIDAPEDPRVRPEGAAPEPPLEPIRAWLERHGLPVPRRYAGGGGVELLEDLGDVSLRDAVEGAGAAQRRALYQEACDLVARLQTVPPPAGLGRRLDGALLRFKGELFTRYALPSRGRPTRAAERECVERAFAAIARALDRAPARLSHRDLQSSNVRVREGPAPRLALIDLQGAWLAPPEYDLVCLLRDSYVELPEAEVEHQLGRVRAQLPDAPAPEALAFRFDLLTLARKGKDLARFHQAHGERGDSRFLRYAGATVRALRAAAERAARREPGLAELASLVAELPEEPCGR